jgi:hypothetical protein
LEVSEPVMPLYYIFHGKLHTEAKKQPFIRLISTALAGSHLYFYNSKINWIWYPNRQLNQLPNQIGGQL